MSHPNQPEIDAELFAAAGAGAAGKVSAALSQGADPDARHGMDGSTALLNALAKGHADAARLLVPVSDLSARDQDGWTPLMCAARGCPAMIAELAPQSDMAARDKMGRTALMLAARAHNLAAITALMPLGGFEERSHNGMSAMDWAMEKSSSSAFAAVRHIKDQAAKLGLHIEAKAAVTAEMPTRRRGL